MYIYIYIYMYIFMTICITKIYMTANNSIPFTFQ